MLRNFLRGLISCAIVCVSALAAFADSPRYIFYFIGDGMGIAPTMSSVIYQRDLTGEASLPLMMTFPYIGQLMTYSASSDVTDSAAAGTALATGSKTRNGMLGMNADTIPVTSIATKLKKKGYGVGLVTNVAADDATPGAFYAHVPHRSHFQTIDRQFITSGFDFLAGASLMGMYDGQGKSTGVLEDYKKAGIKVINDPKDIDHSKRNVLLQKNPFQGSNTGYMIDSIPGMLTLPEMTRAAIGHLETVAPDAFFLMVEGGNIDHALHGNDAKAAITEIYNFNDALAEAYRFMLKHPEETLIVVTADHDTGGISVGNNYTGYEARFQLLEHQKMSKEMFSDLCKKLIAEGVPGGWNGMKALLTEKFGFWNVIPLTDQETASLENLYNNVFEKKNSKDESNLYNNFNAFASDVFRLISTKAGVGWTTGAHTGNPVGVYAVGAGAEQFGHLFNNSELPGTIYKLAR